MAAPAPVPLLPPGRLGIGMQLPIQSHSRIYVADWELHAGPDELVRVAQAADTAGFLYVGTCDHVAVPADAAARMGTFWTDPIATLGMLAGVTARVRLLTHVYVLPYRHPLVAAKAFATLDWLSGGRVIAGVGAGHAEGEFAALGLDFTARGRTLDAAIDAMATALSEEFVGDVGAQPRPVQRPRPPIWVGGSSKAALRRAAERGDGWLPQGTPRKDLPAAIAYLKEHRRSARGDAPIEIGANAEPLYLGSPSWDVGKWTRTGPPAELAGSLREFAGMGVSHVQVRFPARSCDELVDQITAFGAEVAPLLH
jgi:probable F420-dependent oxidoreductase